MTFILKLLKSNFVHSYWTDWCRATKYIGKLELISLAVTRFRISIKRYLKENSFKKILKRFPEMFIKNLRKNYLFERNNLRIDIKKTLCNNNVIESTVLDIFIQVYKLRD